MIYPSINEVKAILKEVSDGSQQPYFRFPVKLEIYADCMTPVMAVRRLKNASHHCFLLESAEQSRQWGRYSFLGYDPSMEITCQNGITKVTDKKTGAVVTKQSDHPGSLIRIGREIFSR